MTDIEAENAGSNILMEFLEVAIYSVLYTRKIYPASIFVRRKKYGIPIQMSVHPYLNEYVTECLKAIEELVKKNEVKKVTITFSNENKQPLERFIFDILALNRALQINNDPYFIKGEEIFRGFFLKLPMIECSLKPLPEDSTFSLQIYTTEAASVSLSEDLRFKDFPWIESEEQETVIKEPSIVPLRTMDTDYLKLQIYVEESAIK